VSKNDFEKSLWHKGRIKCGVEGLFQRLQGKQKSAFFYFGFGTKVPD